MSDQDELADAAERVTQAIIDNECVGCGCPVVEPFGPDQIPLCRACFLIGGDDE